MKLTCQSRVRRCKPHPTLLLNDTSNAPRRVGIVVPEGSLTQSALPSRVTVKLRKLGFWAFYLQSLGGTQQCVHE